MAKTQHTLHHLDIFEFGRQLIETGDLDPTYIMLWEAKLPRRKLCDWLLAYACFYHVGSACWITDHPNYWDALAMAASDKVVPRSSERRHFRGQTSIKAVASLRALQQTPEEIILALGGINERPSLETVMKRVKRHYAFGSWVGFKLADLIERLGLCPVQFQPSDVFNMFKPPREGALLVANELGYRGSDPYTYVYNSLIDNLGGLSAPPRHERTINIQEVETVCCKFHSHRHGNYDVGKDIKEIKHGLLRFARCSLSQKMLQAGIKTNLWSMQYTALSQASVT